MASPSRQIPVPPTPDPDPLALQQWVRDINEPLRNWADATALAISTLQGQVATLQTTVAALQAQVAALTPP